MNVLFCMLTGVIGLKNKRNPASFSPATEVHRIHKAGETLISLCGQGGHEPCLKQLGRKVLCKYIVGSFFFSKILWLKLHLMCDRPEINASLKVIK